MTGYSNDLEKYEKKDSKEGVELDYYQTKNKKDDPGENSKTPVIPVIPVTSDLKPASSNVFGGDGFKTQPVITRHTRHQDQIKIGDRVENRQTGEQGLVTTWYKGRTKAALQLDNGSLTDWILQSDLILLEAS